LFQELNVLFFIFLPKKYHYLNKVMVITGSVYYFVPE